MKVLDLDMDYFVKKVATRIVDSETNRLSEEEYGGYVWTEREIRDFLENNLGLSKERRIKGRVVSGHNESLFYWKELIESQRLATPFEVVHVDSHADLGVGYTSWIYILNELLKYPVEERINHAEYFETKTQKMKGESIGDYLLYAIAYGWISELIYCGNPYGDHTDYRPEIIKDFAEKLDREKTVYNTIQLIRNPYRKFPVRFDFDTSGNEKKLFLRQSIKEPEVPFTIIPTVNDVKFDGDFDFVVLAQSPNYTPASADFIMDIFREYIEE